MLSQLVEETRLDRRFPSHPQKHPVGRPEGV